MQTRIKLFLTLFITYAFFTNTYLTTNDASRFSLTAAIVEEHTLEIDNFLDRVISDWWWAKDFAFYNGHIYSDKAPLGSFLGVPIYFAARFFTSDFGILAYVVSLFTTGLLTTATALLIYDLGKYFTDKRQTKAALALSYGLGSAAFFYGTVFFSQAITAFLGFASFYLLFGVKHDNRPMKNMFLAGALAGLAIASDYYAGVVVIALLFYASSINPRKTYLFFLPLLLTLLLLFAYHWAIFEDPFAVPYLYANLYTKYHSAGFYGVAVPDIRFISNLAAQILGLWGFLFTTPLAVLSFAFLPSLRKKYGEETAVILFVTVGLFYVTGSIGRFDAYGSRLLTPLLPFLFLSLYTINFDNKANMAAFYTLALISLIINFAAVDTFLPKIADPAVIRATSGNHNILGEFLLKRGINLHYLTIIPLMITYALIWKSKILSIFKNLNIKE
jgi:4-amino-4-deoxy-L-arabinose transferase-like glycosyltransferase